MSQRAVESILGRLITDEEFRKEFFREPLQACRNNDWGVTPAELSALLGLDPELLHDMAGSLDPKIVRAIATDGPADGKQALKAADGTGNNASKNTEPQPATRRH
jgi:hypothetical protein